MTLAPDASGVSPVLTDERLQAIATLTSAFSQDPVESWLYPEQTAYEQHFPNFVQAFGGQAIGGRTAWRLAAFTGVALWLPPGATPDAEAIVAALVRGVLTDRHSDMFMALEQMGAAHPHFAHWYLPWFGVRQEVQGRGYGSRLMSFCLAIIDASGLPAYLETPNPRTISFYERHGFHVTGATDAGECPPITFMLREAAIHDPSGSPG